MCAAWNKASIAPWYHGHRLSADTAGTIVSPRAAAILGKIAEV